jgi:hypothetical protein
MLIFRNNNVKNSATYHLSTVGQFEFMSESVQEFDETFLRDTDFESVHGALGLERFFYSKVTGTD